MRAGRASRSLPALPMTASPRRFLRVLPVLVMLALGGCGDDDGGGSSEDRERVKRVVASYAAAYLEGRGEDACALYTAELRARIEYRARQRGVYGCERALEVAADVLQTGQSGKLRGQVRELLADPRAVRVRLRDERALAWVVLPSKLLSDGVVLEHREDEWRIARLGVHG
jgi:hypothetical protein